LAEAAKTSGLKKGQEKLKKPRRKGAKKWERPVVVEALSKSSLILSAITKMGGLKKA